MARGRFVNRKISVSDKLNNLPDDTCRLLATWIIPYLDKNGVYHARPAIVKNTVFTLREDLSFAQVETYLQAMQDVQLIVLFDGGDGKQYQYWPGFEDEQPNLRKDREATDLPEPPSYEECLKVWGESDCQAVDGQLTGSDQAVDGQEPGYIKVSDSILEENESQKKTGGGSPAEIPPPLSLGDSPPPLERHTINEKDIPAADPEMGALWQTEMLPELQGAMTKATYDQWLAHSLLLGVVDHRAVVQVANNYAVEWCEKRLYPTIFRTVSDILRMTRQVEVNRVAFVPQPGGT